jgi:signal transduction histidine kinase
VLLLAGAYVVAAKFGLDMDAVSGFATLVWPASGLALAALVLGGRGLWPGIALGALVVNLWNGAPVPVALGIATGNTLEAVVAASVIGAGRGFHPSLDQVRGVLTLAGLGALLSTLLSATVGVASLGLAGLVAPGQLWPTWRAWWMGDAIGILVVTPMIMTWAVTPRPVLRFARVAEVAALITVLVVLGLYVFTGVFGPGFDPLRQRSTIMPVLIWAALRFGPRGAASATFLVWVLAIWGTAQGQGPFAADELHLGLELLQGYMAVLAVTFLVLAALTEERRRAAAERAEVLVSEQIARGKAERAVRLRDEMLGVVSHDLRNPLQAITAGASSILKASGRTDVEESVELIKQAAGRMNRLLHDLVDTAIIEAGSLSVNRVPLEAAELAREVVELWRPVAEKQKAALVAAITDPRQPVLCDRDRMLQALSNLVSNALRVTVPEGNVVVGLRRVDADVQFSVRDNGPGIAPESVPYLFDRYWRAPGERGDGSGLGLFITKAIVDAHGGRIWVQSRPGEGATFFVSLPANHPA